MFRVEEGSHQTRGVPQSNFSRRKIILRYAALTGKCGSGKVLAVVSGGNIDLAKFTELVSASQPHPGGTGTPACARHDTARSGCVTGERWNVVGSLLSEITIMVQVDIRAANSSFNSRTRSWSKPASTSKCVSFEVL
jgi:hypothetical protein